MPTVHYIVSSILVQMAIENLSPWYHFDRFLWHFDVRMVCVCVCGFIVADSAVCIRQLLLHSLVWLVWKAHIRSNAVRESVFVKLIFKLILCIHSMCASKSTIAITMFHLWSAAETMLQCFNISVSGGVFFIIQNALNFFMYFVAWRCFFKINFSIFSSLYHDEIQDITHA